MILASGRNFADALAGAYLAAKKSAPIIMVNSKNNMDEIKSHMYSWHELSRISGKSRYETSIEIAKKFFPDADTAVLDYAKNYTDGLCGGLLACNIDFYINRESCCRKPCMAE